MFIFKDKLEKPVIIKLGFKKTEMAKLKFKTNIYCGNCVKSVSGFINEVQNLKAWTVDTENPDKILTVEGDGIEVKNIIEAVEDAGFDIEVI